MHKEDDVIRKDVRPVDTELVRRAGDVIPEVVGPIIASRPARTRKWKFPTQCPECEQPLVRVEGEANHHCVNVDCPAQRVASEEGELVRGLGVRLALQRDGAVAELQLGPDALFYPSAAALAGWALEAAPGQARRVSE